MSTTTTSLKSITQLYLRDLTKEDEATIHALMSHFDEKTGTAAAKRAINGYLRKVDEVKQLRKDLTDAYSSLQDLTRKHQALIEEVVDCFEAEGRSQQKKTALFQSLKR